MFISSLLFGISASLDALLVGVSYGIRQIRIRLWQNLIISLVTLLGTCLSVGLGHRLASLLPDIISNYAGSLILIALGMYYIAKWAAALLQKQRCKAHSLTRVCGKYELTSAEGHSSCLKLTEVFTLSLTLSLNNLSAGLSASLAGLALIPTAITTLVCSVLFLFFGNRLGDTPILQLAGRAADPVSGILLMGLGAVQFLW